MRSERTIQTDSPPARIGMALAAGPVAPPADPQAAGRNATRFLRRHGGRLLWASDDAYPAALRDALCEAAPPLLLALGDATLLRRPTVSIIGSRRPSAAATRAAAALARSLAGAGCAVVTGGAAGIDTSAARHAGQVAVVIPAEGLAPFLRRGRGRRPGCLLGQFPPDAPWAAAQALARNRTIAALGQFVVAFEPRDTGGTWHGANQALRLGRPLVVVSDSPFGPRGRGWRVLARRGALVLSPTGLPGPLELAALLAAHRPAGRIRQVGLPGWAPAGDAQARNRT